MRGGRGELRAAALGGELAGVLVDSCRPAIWKCARASSAQSAWVCGLVCTRFSTVSACLAAELPLLEPPLPLSASTRPPASPADAEQDQPSRHQDRERRVHDLDGAASAAASEVEEHRSVEVEWLVLLRVFAPRRLRRYRGSDGRARSTAGYSARRAASRGTISSTIVTGSTPGRSAATTAMIDDRVAPGAAQPLRRQDARAVERDHPDRHLEDQADRRASSGSRTCRAAWPGRARRTTRR